MPSFRGVLQCIDGLGDVARAPEKHWRMLSPERRKAAEGRALDLNRPCDRAADATFAFDPLPQQSFEFFVKLVDIAVALESSLEALLFRMNEVAPKSLEPSPLL